ncbi:MAG: hypothetical protein HY700_15430 [Gemmatimonadetes bacterium]|nr:hypothetical protein [Gemmatimonadota bacterium]
MQRLRRWAFVLLVATGCGGHPKIADTAPVSPEAAVRAFMNAVKANSIVGLRDLWGTERGPAVSSMNLDQVDQRLTVIRTFLEHESYEFEPGNSVDPVNSMQRIVRVRLTRKGCQPVVPFTTVPWKNGWLVKNIDLSAAGNPARTCEASQGAGGGT